MNILETILFNLKMGRTLECSKYKTHKFPTQNQHMKAIKQKCRIFGSQEMLAFRFSRFHFTLDWAHIWNIVGWNPCYVSEKSPFVPDHIWSSGLVHKNRSNKENSALQKLKTATEYLLEFFIFFSVKHLNPEFFSLRFLMINEGSLIFVELIMFPKCLLKFKRNSGDLLRALLAEKKDFTLFSRKL